MSDVPTTPSGKQILADWLMLKPKYEPNTALIRDRIVAAEREARTAALADLRTRVEAIAWVGDERAKLVGRAAVLALIRDAEQAGADGEGSEVRDLRAEAAKEARTAALARAVKLVGEVIFDFPIGEDVTYSRGYSAGVAAARESLRAALIDAEVGEQAGKS